MVQVLLPLGMYLLSSTSITLIVYFHHWTQDLTLIKCELSFHHRWLIRYGLVPHPLMMSSLYLVISKDIISLSILSSKNHKIFQTLINFEYSIFQLFIHMFTLCTIDSIYQLSNHDTFVILVHLSYVKYILYSR